MLLIAKELLQQRLGALQKIRSGITKVPTLALIWVGDDEQTGIFVRAKQALAKKLDCQFMLHQFPAADQKQLEAVLDGLNNRKDIDGILIQLPLPKNVDTDKIIAQIKPEKDVDNLSGQSTYDSPTVLGILALLNFHHIDPGQLKVALLGAGRLVGAPLIKKFAANNWPITIIDKQARQDTAKIQSHDLLIAATGVKNLVTPAMVHDQMIVVDGSGRDVDVETIEPLVKAVTPQKGAIGPLTVSFLYANLLQACATES